jgi:hypothetical protein
VGAVWPARYCARVSGWIKSADIGDEGCIVAVEERLYIGEVGVEREVRRRCEREQSVLSERKITSDGGVVPVAGGVEGNERVVGVVAAEEKNADQRFVIGGALREGIERAKRAQAENIAGSCQACAFDEGSPVCTHCDLPCWRLFGTDYWRTISA